MMSENISASARVGKQIRGKFLTTNIVVLFTLFGVSLPAISDPDVVVKEAWVEEGAPDAMALAGYMEIHNQGKKSLILTGASSPDFGEVMLHATIVANGRARMESIERLEIKPRDRALFKPRGSHVMLIDPKRQLKKGDRITLFLNFKDRKAHKLVLPVKSTY